MRTKSMRVIDNNLYVGNYSLVELADKYKTPLYVYDEVGIEEKIKIFSENFKSNKFTFEIIYASKAFLAPYLCKMLDAAGFGIDAVSCGDMHLINKSGFPMNRVILHGNNKSIEELEMAIDLEIEYIVVDSFAELVKLEELAKAKKKKVNTLFRINPGDRKSTRLNSSHVKISYAVFCLKKKK